MSLASAPAPAASRAAGRGGRYASSHRRHLTSPAVTANELDNLDIPADIIGQVPESVARENTVLPLGLDDERVTLVAIDPENLPLADKLRFILARDIRLVGGPLDAILRAINRHYCHSEDESADSCLMEFTDTAIDFTETAGPSLHDSSEIALSSIDALAAPPRARHRSAVAHSTFSGHQSRGEGMFFYTVEEGQRVLLRRLDGTMEVLTGPRRVWKGSRTFERMSHFVAHPGYYLVVRFRDGSQQHLAGPAELWFDPRIHEAIDTREALQIAAQEAVVVYTRPAADSGGKSTASRRIVYGPALFVPEPGEWLHRFSWHASKGGSRGVEKVPNALVFHKLWLMPDQMYHDVHDVRTADDAVLTIRLMIFFELIDINRMLDATHDPIGDFVNAATADVVEFTGQHQFEAFKRNTAALNDLATYRQLASRAAQCGYRISNVVYRGYGAAQSLQTMHDQAIEARTKLQLDRATEQQAQELEDFRLSSQLARAAKRREEQTGEVVHDLDLAAKKAAAALALRERQHEFARGQRQADARLRDEIARTTAAQQQDHFRTLKELGVDLTAYLTQGRADRVIELRGGAMPAHVHLDRLDEEGQAKNGRSTAIA